MKCKNCGNDIIPTKKFSVLLFILLLILGIFPALIYLVIYLTKKANICPICKKNIYKSKEINNTNTLAFIVITVIILLMLLVISL